MLFEAYPEAITGMKLHEVLGWGARAIQHAVESDPEVIWGYIYRARGNPIMMMIIVKSRCCR